MKILTKLLLVILSVTLLSILVFNLIFYVYSTKLIDHMSDAQLTSVVVLKENQIRNYFSRASMEITELSSDPEIIDYMIKFHPGNYSGMTPAGTNPAEGFAVMKNESALKLSRYLGAHIKYLEFDDITVLTSDGVVELSTDASEKGKIRSDMSYFIEGSKGIYVQDFYTLSSTGEPVMVVSAPILSNNTVVGVIAANVRLKDISDIMVERSGLGETGETILVGSNHLLLSESRFKGIPYKDSISNDAIDACIDGKAGRGRFIDYRGVKVSGVYDWIPEYNLCLVAKMDMRELREPLDDVMFMSVIFLIMALLIILMIAYLFSRSITKPINELVDMAGDLSHRDFNHKIDIMTNDELKVFGDAFNHAMAELAASESREKEYREKLEKELEEKTLNLKRGYEELESSKKAALNILEDLSATNAHLKDLDKAKTDFLNVASHELKTPLTAISAYIEILDEYRGQFDAEQLQGLDAIKRNSNQLKILINNILEISRLDSGRFELNPTEINIDDKIKSILGNLKILADTKHLELKYESNNVSTMFADATRFEEILNNLLGNAVKFTDTGSITVSATPGAGLEDGFIVFSVKDTGTGIPEDKMKNLFQNFYQADSTVSRKYGGTGLGLSITRKLVELMGGKISVARNVDVGVTFKFILPIRLPEHKKIEDIDEDGLDDFASFNGSNDKDIMQSKNSQSKNPGHNDMTSASGPASGSLKR